MTKQIRDYILEARQIRESKEQKNEDANSYVLSDTIDDIKTQINHLIKTYNVLYDKLQKALDSENLQETRRLLKNSEPEQTAKSIVNSFTGANNIVNKLKELSFESIVKNEAGISTLSKNEKDFIEKTKKKMPYAKIFKHPRYGILSYTPDDGTFEDIRGNFYDFSDINKKQLTLIDESAQKNETGVIKISPVTPITQSLRGKTDFKLGEYQICLYEDESRYRQGIPFFSNPEDRSWTLKDAKDWALKWQKRYPGKYQIIVAESAQKNEAEFKPKLSENELKRNVDTSLKWLKVLLDDQKRKLKDGSWDEEEIEDTIDNVNSIIKGLEEIKRDLMS